jgi:hypothetical protein
MARAAGETWEDVLEYYLVSSYRLAAIRKLSHVRSSTPIEAKLTSPIDSGKYFTREVYMAVLAELRRAAKVLVLLAEILPTLDIIFC